ncbi:DUF4394 domain-containing protein [Actinosynnema sp. NPDC050436]|uniref:DUF4394 domain-containing protein n=1 Tax=Actinosynnema sp. NPDC050436 TaxID=3155659 RepID=UPI003402F6D9
MSTRIRRGIVAASAIAGVVASLVVGLAGESAAKSYGLRAFGITSDGKLMAQFGTNKPQELDWVRAVSGLSGDVSLIGLDFRVQNNTLYGVGNAGGIYTISIPDVVVKKVSQLGVALDGGFFGVDFNPAANRLRVVSNTGQNLRHNIDDGPTAGTTVVDQPLSTPPAPAPTPGVSAVAYTNNDLNADTATTLFDINTTTDQVVVQSPANNGTLAPTGALGVDAGPNAGLDIFSDLSGGKTVAMSAFATLVPNGGSGPATLYSVNLLTGAAAGLGQFPLAITDIAVALDTN